MAGGDGSDPHGWRNALNYYGWGAGALVAGARVYDDFSYSSYSGAMKSAVRALVATGKPVGMLGWRGAHAQMITGYYGLVGNPFAKDATGKYTNTFTVSGFYLSDPLRSSKAVNRTISYTSLAKTTDPQVALPALLRDRQPVRRPVHPGLSRLEDGVVLPLRPDPARPLAPDARAASAQSRPARSPDAARAGPDARAGRHRASRRDAGAGAAVALCRALVAARRLPARRRCRRRSSSAAPSAPR